MPLTYRSRLAKANDAMSDGMNSARRALIVFEDRTEPGWLRCLRPGFRHCFCLIGTGPDWTILDPLLSRIEILSLTGQAEEDLAAHYLRTGRRVVAGQVVPGGAYKPFLPRPLTCVEVVKRALSFEAPTVFTPRQLYRTLIRSRQFRPL